MTTFHQSKSGLIVPASVQDRPPCGKCFVCGFEAYRRGEMERHIEKCAEENAEAIRANSPRRGPQDPAIWDTEMEQYMKWGGRTSHRKWDAWFREHRIDPGEFDRNRKVRRPTR